MSGAAHRLPCARPAPQWRIAAFAEARGWSWNIHARVEGDGLLLEIAERGSVNHLALGANRARAMLAAVVLGLEEANMGEERLMIAGVGFSRCEARAIARVLAAGLRSLDGARDERGPGA